jgi:hypothetical protein
MNKPYIIIFENIPEKQNEESFFEVIRSSYVSKKANDNIFIISVPDDTSASKIYINITDKLNVNISFLVVKLNDFFGSLTENIFQWIRDTFPDIIIASESEVRKELDIDKTDTTK